MDHNMSIPLNCERKKTSVVLLMSMRGCMLQISNNNNNNNKYGLLSVMG
jgi:hypothetical protein